MKPGIRWYRVVVPRFVAGIQAHDAWVVEAAPIMSWAEGKKFQRVRAWVERKGGKVELLKVSRL